MKDGITVTRAMEVTSDAFQVTESR